MSSINMPANAPIYQLGSDFYDEVSPALFPEKILRYLNARMTNAHSQSDHPLKSIPPENFWNFKPLENNIQKPLALKYHGHQFRHYNPDLGDGRGFLYAQFQYNNEWFDLGTKGSGQTPYSRQGDGRLTLKGAVREALATEMLNFYGLFCSETACIYETGENLTRNDEPSPTRSAVLTRLTRGHIRIGTFQRLAYLNQFDQIKKLTSYVLKNYYYDHFKKINSEEDQAHQLFQCVSQRLAEQAAQLMISGFVHGVLNSDNINITGEIFDFGPYRFLPKYDPHFTAAYFDHSGLYSFGRQPESLLWNLAQLGLSLEKAYPEFKMQPYIDSFEKLFHQEFQKVFQSKLNVKFSHEDDSEKAVNLFYKTLSEVSIGYELAFFVLHTAQEQTNPVFKDSSAITFLNHPQIQELQKIIKNGSIIDSNILSNDYFKLDQPETLLIDEIESIWKPIAENDDWSLFEKKLQSLRRFKNLYKL